jgi:DNA-binding winged helix-turn-helix (wHTH) protein/predicted ATPase
MSRAPDLVFPPFRLDRSEGRLYCSGEPVRLRPKSYALLTYLSEHAGELVTKERLLESLWPGTYVSDTVLKVCVRELRQALGDAHASPRFIETAHRRGYRFIAPVTSIDPLETASGTLSATLPLQFEVPSGGLVGRQVELAWLCAVAERAAAGRRQLAFVSGEPGIGKSALAAAFVGQLAQAAKAVVARGQCVEHHGPAEAYLPWLEALSRLAAGPEGERVREVLSHIAPSWLAQMPALADPATAERVRGVLASTSRPRMLREMADALEALARDTLLVVVLDDLHWSDPSSLDLLGYLARRRDPARLMLVGLFRPAEAADSGRPFRGVLQGLHAQRCCEERALALLTPDDVHAYAAAVGTDEDARRLGGLLFQSTEGNPLFIVSLLEEMRRRDIVYEVEGRFRLRDVGAMWQRVVPESLRHLIDHQFERLEPVDQRLLEAAAVAGHEWDARTIAGALDHAPADIEHHAESLAARRLFIRAATDAAHTSRMSRFAFQHAMYRDALYEGLTTARRRALHAKVAGALELNHATVLAGDGELANHFDHGDRPDRAVAYYRMAAVQSMRRYAVSEAETHLDRALALLPAIGDASGRAQHELRLRLLQGVLLAATRGHSAAATNGCYRRAGELADDVGDSRQRFQAGVGRWASELVGARLAAAQKIAEELVGLAEDRLGPDERVQARWTAEVTAVNRGDAAAAVAHFDAAMAIAPASDPFVQIELFGHDARATCRGFGAWALWMIGETRRSRDVAFEAVAVADELRHPHTLAFAYFFLSFVHALGKDATATLEWADRTVAVGEEHGLRQWLAFGRILRGWARGVLDPMSTGAEELDDALNRYAETGAAISRPHFLGLRAETLAARGQAAAALALVEEAIRTAKRTGELYYLPELLRLDGMLVKTGRSEEGPSAPGDPA